MKEHQAIITLFGKPNVGKSSLVNALTKQKFCAVTPKPQTTIKALRAVVTLDNFQLIFMDTPGIQKRSAPIAHRAMNRIASREVMEADIQLMVIDVNNWQSDDDLIIDDIQDDNIPKILVLNKIDLCNDEKLQATIKRAQSGPFKWIIPISSKTNENIPVLLYQIKALCPEKPWTDFENFSLEDQQKVEIEDCIREQLLRLTNQEIPYLTKILVTELKETEERFHVHVDLIVDRQSRKKLLIGTGGAMIKRIGTESRLSIQDRWQKSVFLKTNVVVTDK